MRHNKLISGTDPFVSIHASVKDATQLTDSVELVIFVSIHASVKDATALIYRRFAIWLVSIHASVKDAT